VSALELIAAERDRQISKGYDATHDDQHNDDLSIVATQVIFAAATGEGSDGWGIVKKHAGNPVKLLTIAGALIVAEIERRQRLKSKAERSQP